MSNVGSIPYRPTDVNMARCDVGICCQPLKLAFTGSIPVRVTQRLLSLGSDGRRISSMEKFESPGKGGIQR